MSHDNYVVFKKLLALTSNVTSDYNATSTDIKKTKAVLDKGEGKEWKSNTQF